ncbi:MAG: efflux RND transporter periplasmic adaptor subunit [Pseudomonadota bacterium]
MQANQPPTSRPARPWLYRLFLPLIILALAAGVFMALKASKPQPQKATPEERAWLIETTVVEPASHHPVITLHGEVANPDRLTVRAPLAGRVDSLPVEDGQPVDPGDELVTLDPSDFRPVLDRARANLAELEAQIREIQASHESDRAALALEREIVENARTALQRSRDLRERNLASQADVDSARDVLSQARLALNTRRERLATYDARLAGLEARRDAAAADVAAAERDVARARVSAPTEGIVGTVQVTPGSMVSTNAALLDFYPWDGFELRALIPTARVDSLARALTAGEPPRARVSDSGQRLRLDRLAAEASGEGVTGLFDFVEPGASLRAGQVFSLELRLPLVENAVAIPRSALYGNDRLYRIVDGRLESLRVERLGTAANDAEAGDRLLVRSPALSAGDRIATTQLPNAVDGLRVRWNDSGTADE